MINKYIRGDKERSSEVIKTLEELGGKNTFKYSGEYENGFYYINDESIIDFAQSTSNTGRIIQECFEEIKLPEQLNIVIKEPKQIYWFRTTEDNTKNQALFDKLCDLVDINKRNIKDINGIIYFNPLENLTTFCSEHYLRSSLECTIAMMVGKELIIDSSKDNTEYVDLGLPSGTLWATCNIGANKPEEYGDYFEFENWDSSLQVPTKEEFEELKDKCKWEFTTYNSKKGFKVIGPNGNSIFLPAAGVNKNSSFYYRIECGNYWSSTQCKNDNNCSYKLFFIITPDINLCNHDYGQSVRCVKRK